MRVRTIALASLATCLALTLTACGAGNNAATSLIKNVTDGAEGSISVAGNDMKVRNLLLVSQSDGSAVVVGTIINSAPATDTLLKMLINGAPAELSQPNFPLVQDKPLRFSGDSANGKASLANLKATPGDHVEMKLYFATAGEITLHVIVHDQSGTYAGVTK